MKNIFLFAGTSEGRKIAEHLAERKIHTDVFVVSGYGADLLPKSPDLMIHIGRLDQKGILAKIRELAPDLVVDATHPYAAEATENICLAAKQAGVRYIRVERGLEELNAETKDPDRENKEFLGTDCILVPDAASAAEYLKTQTGAIFLTTGSKELAAFAGVPELKDRIFVRVLPSGKVLESCEKLGVDGRHLIMMQGPFSEDLNYAMFQSTNAKWLVTKNSGKAGGFLEKCRAANRLGMGILVIGRPKVELSEDAEVMSPAAFLKLIGRDLYLIGMGPGALSLVSEEARSAILKADLLLGSKRMIELAHEVVKEAGGNPKPYFTTYRPTEMKTYLDAHSEMKSAAFLYSGDIRVYSGAQQAEEIFEGDDRIHHIYGLSSVEYMEEQCGIEKGRSRLISIHGREADLKAEIAAHRYVTALLGGSESFRKICGELGADPKTRRVKITLGERLSYPDERLTRGLPKDFLKAEIDSLSIAVFENEWMKRLLPRVMVAAPKSGSGKTTLTCGLIRAFQNRGRKVAAFKCGPDYIDPMFHASTLQVKTGNLDSFFTKPEELRSIFAGRAQDQDLSILEGAMGFYDGLGGISDRASSWEIAEITKTPVILVVDAKGASLSLVPVVEGLLSFRKEPRIRGLILNRVSKGFYPRLKSLLEEQLKEQGFDLPVLGYLPENPAFAVPSRHLGLVAPEEMESRRNWADLIAGQLEETVDLDEIEKIALAAPELDGAIDAQKGAVPDIKEGICAEGPGKGIKVSPNDPDNQILIPENGHKEDLSKANKTIRLAVARDQAFSFYYTENEEFLRSLGADLIWFSPLHDRHFPQNADGLILGGGYPELFTEALWKNETMRQEICRAVKAGLPTIAECGGYLYLLDLLTGRDGEKRSMCGVISGEAADAGHLVRFGYFRAETAKDGIFGPKGTTLLGHEFHYWESTNIGDGFLMSKPPGKRTWQEEIYTDTLAAGFPHFYYPGCPEAIENFLQVCRRKRRGNAGNQD